MPYEADLDKELFAEVVDFENTRIRAGVFSYNGGEKKLQIVRENLISDGEWRYVKLGRMSRDEVAGLVPVIQKALEQMN